MKQIMVSVLAAGASLAAFGYDADTIALYDFTGGEAETTINNKTFVNLANPGTCDGTAEFGSKAENLAVFDADRPGKYIFERAARGETPIIADPMSIRGETTGAGSGYPRIRFPDLGTIVSSNEDWTIEFFFKFESGDASSWTSVLNMNCGLIYNPSQMVEGAHPELAGTPQKLMLVFPDPSVYTYIYSATYHAATLNFSTSVPYKNEQKKFRDGLWHHYACVYLATKKRFTMYTDYGEAIAADTRDTERVVLEESEPLTLLNGGFDGRMACLRISKGARHPSCFLRASERADFIEESVIHLCMAGENGTALNVATNRFAIENPFVGQFIGRVNPNGVGTAVSTTVSGARIGPVFTNDLVNVRRRGVFCDGTLVGENLGSAYFPIKQRTDEAYWLPSTGIKIAVTNYIPIEAGSFTVEMFFRSDPELDTRIAGTTYPRYTFFCFYNKGLYSDWQMSGSYYPDLASGNCYLSCGASPPDGTTSVVGTSYNGTKVMHDGEWHHFAVVYDDDARPRTQTLYVDGVKKYQNKLTAPLMPRNSADNPRCNYHLQIGYGANNHPIQGTFDEFRIVRKALQPSEFMKFKSLNGILMIVR